MTTKADTSVKWFHSEMPDAPVLRGESGALIQLLDACLINGFSTRTPDSIVVSAGVATVNISAGNPYEQHAVIAISGAANAALNAEWRIDTSSATSFTFLCPGVADGTVTGASVKRAGAGWGKPFSGTNVAAYQSLDTASTQLYLRVDDADARYARVRGYENMVDETESNSTGPFPKITQLSAVNYTWAKSTQISTLAHSWFFVADGAQLVFTPRFDGTPYGPLYVFGDTTKTLLSDSYNCVIVASEASAPGGANSGHSGAYFTSGGVYGAPYLARNRSQLGGAIQGAHVCSGSSSYSGVGYTNYPVSESPLLLFGPSVILESTAPGSTMRGANPAIYQVCNNYAVPNFPYFEAPQQLGAEAIIAIVACKSAGSNGSVGLRINGPWRSDA